jgi:transposase
VFISKGRFTKDEKIAILHWIEQGHTDIAATHEFAVNRKTISTWRRIIQVQGSEALAEKSKNQIYTQSFKLLVVQAYLSGEGSLQELTMKFGLRTNSLLRKWIMKYSRGEVIQSSRGGLSQVMTKGRKTSYEERLEIVRYCEAQGNNYQQTAEMYEVSYQQVYSWARKCEKAGEKALYDRRGKQKEAVALTELDRLKLENRKLQKANRDLEVENAFLKKLEELERRSR